MFQWFKSKKAAVDLEARVKALEDGRKVLLLDWDDTYERFRLLYSRLSKRVKRAEELEQSPETEDTQPGESEPLESSKLSLSPRARAIQEQILRRRGVYSRRDGE